MNSKRFHLVLIGIIGLLFVGLIAGAYGINQLMAARATKLSVLKAKDIALGEEQQSIIQAQKDIKTYANLQKTAQAIVPEDKDQAEAVREIVNIAASNKISLASINFPASTLGAGLPATPGAAATPKPAAGANTKAALSQLTPVKNIPGVYQLPITVTGDSNNPVSYNQLINFLQALEHNRRTSQVSTINIQPNANSTYLNFVLTINEYIKP